MKCQILQFRSILLLILLVPLSGQPKVSVDLGMGFYEPTMKGFDKILNSGTAVDAKGKAATIWGQIKSSY